MEVVRQERGEMTARQHGAPGLPALHSGAAPGGEASPWLTLTDLGRLYGISAVHCGRLLSEAGLRDPEGQPTSRALDAGCATERERQRQGGQPFWHRQHCRRAFEAAGLVTVQRATLVQQWAALLSALTEGSPSISTSADQMAEELPGELVEPVNRQLRKLGCSFQVQRTSHGVNRGGGVRNGAQPELTESPTRKERPNHGPAGRPRRHAANGSG
jgi:hypothetical protein